MLFFSPTRYFEKFQSYRRLKEQDYQQLYSFPSARSSQLMFCHIWTLFLLTPLPLSHIIFSEQFRGYGVDAVRICSICQIVLLGALPLVGGFPVWGVIFDCELLGTRIGGASLQLQSPEEAFFLVCSASRPASSPLVLSLFSSLGLWCLGISSSFLCSPAALGICSNRIFWFSGLSYYCNWKFPWFWFSQLRDSALQIIFKA